MTTSISSPFKKCKATFPVVLPPQYLGNMESGVLQSLDERLMSYDETLQGCIVGYSSVKSLSRTGRLLADRPFTHLDISANFLLFAPTLNSILEGIVQKVSPDHIGILVFGTFNASIPKEYIHHALLFDAQRGGWVDDHDSDTIVTVGSQIAFEIVKIYTEESRLVLTGNMKKKPSAASLAGSVPYASLPTSYSPPPAVKPRTSGKLEAPSTTTTPAVVQSKKKNKVVFSKKKERKIELDLDDSDDEKGNFKRKSIDIKDEEDDHGSSNVNISSKDDIDNNNNSNSNNNNNTIIKEKKNKSKRIKVEDEKESPGESGKKNSNKKSKKKKTSKKSSKKSK